VVRGDVAFQSLVAETLAKWTAEAATNSFRHCGFSVPEEAQVDEEITEEEIAVLIVVFLIP
jgi:hypothetical protein